MNALTMNQKFVMLILAVLPLLIGCSRGDGFPRVSIQGEATLDNQPIQDASFTLVPPVEGKNSPSVYGVISNGKYRLPRNLGPVPGPHRVELTIFGKAEKPSSSESQGKRVKELGAYTVDIVVPENGSDSLDIVVSSDK